MFHSDNSYKVNNKGLTVWGIFSTPTEQKFIDDRKEKLEEKHFLIKSAFSS